MKPYLTGEFSRWTVVKPMGVIKHNRGTSYLCRCVCGNERVVEGYALTRGESTSCGCYHVDSRRKKPFEALYNRLVRTASEHNHGVQFSYEEFVKFTCEKTCHYCSGPVEWNAYTSLWEPKRLRRVKDSEPLPRTKHTGYNLDRKDNSLGYSVDNCVVCCGSCNRTKGDRFTYEEFLIIAHSLRLVQYLRNPMAKEQMNFMHTFSGKMFRYLKPDPEDVCIEDIAHGLSQLNRFVGQTTKPYSVAQHSVLVSQTCPKEFALYGLLHDASEAYTNDVCRVLKLSPGMGIYKWYENLAMSAVCKKFGLPEKEPAEVKTADLVLLLTEKRDLFKNTCLWAVNKYDGTSHLEPLKKKIRPWTAEEAEEKFLDRFTQLKT
jgi:5'-deoxynucleotidase YfbR-like HD superfamily hydrolase